VETGEFANVGVVMIAPDQRFFDFKLLMTRHSRVTHFFEQLDAKVFRATMRNLRDELERVKAVLMGYGFDRRYRVTKTEAARSLFDELIRARETVVRFSEPRAILAEAPAVTLGELFAFHVERNFVNRQYQEQVLERGVRRLLSSIQVSDRFVQMQIGDEEYHANFPFVEQIGDQPVRIIKPLHLAHDQPSKILDHGGQWLFRLSQLQRRELLPERVLFAVQGPSESGTPRAQAAEEIVGALRDGGVEVAPLADQDALISFVRH